MFGLGYERPSSATEFLKTYYEACTRNTSTLIEVRTDREENVTLHRQLLEEISY
ncbi:MAG: hypothetical protein M3380_10600 [Chloroflexota bacterium]|nr:hypothetical protein [Chloroflexota bacterium]